MSIESPPGAARDLAQAAAAGAALVQPGGGRLGVPLRRARQVHHGEDGEGEAPVGRREAGAGARILCGWIAVQGDCMVTTYR